MGKIGEMRLEQHSKLVKRLEDMAKDVLSESPAAMTQEKYDNFVKGAELQYLNDLTTSFATMVAILDQIKDIMLVEMDE